MSDSPVIFKRSKPKPGQRARHKSPDAVDATTSQGDESPIITLASKLKNKAKRAKQKSRLSFGGDDDEGDGEVFQVKKSNLSQKLKLGTHPASPANLSASLDHAHISNGTPSYSAAYLSELKASTPSSRRPPSNDPYDADMSMDIGDFSMQSIDSVDVFADNELSIPSEASILNAKQKRERIRTTTASNDDDYISLSVIKRSDENQGPHPDSRLVREEDELGEGDDEFAEYTSAQERIPLGKKSKKVAASKRKEAMLEMLADAEEEDDETMEWEQEQLRRGGHLADDESINQAPVKPVYIPTPIPASTPIPTLGPSIARLTQSLTLLTASHATNVSSMSTLAEEREQLDKREAEMREMVQNAEGKRSWFVTFREWVESVATFLDEKFPQLEKLEDEHVSLLKERSDMISQRRRADDEDDLSLFLGSLPSPPQPDIEEIDELGRTVPRANPAAVRRDRIAARAARRSRRSATSTSQNQEDGYSTDSSLPPSDKADLNTALSKLSTSARAILSDVRAKEFKDPSVGLGKWFGEWREKFGDVYTGAWGGLGLVGAWEFWVRLEIIGWNPFEDSRSLDAFRWYSSLYEYSRPPAEADEEEPELGPDGDLVSAMISTAIVPRLCKIIEGGAFDAYSATSLRRIVDLAEQVEASIERNNLKFQMLLKSVYTVFANEISLTESLIGPYLSLNNPPFNPESIPARQRFLTRRIKLVQNLLRWRKFTGERFGIGQLTTRLVDMCITPLAESGWDVGGEERIQKVAAILPRELVPASLKVRLR